MQVDRTIQKGAKLRICEIYASLQGEGLLTGTPSIFVRTSGCNLRCWFCDTPFASWNPEGEFLQIAEISHRISQRIKQAIATQGETHSDQQPKIKHVVLTGGEPMIYACLPELTSDIRQAGLHLTIETAGTVWRDLECDLWSISPKLASSAPKQPGSWQIAHQARRQRLDVVRRMMQQSYQLKFVVNDLQDAQEVLNYLELLGQYESSRVLLMPQGTTVQQLDAQAAWLRPWCEQHGFTYCQRQHIYWYGNRRGT